MLDKQILSSVLTTVLLFEQLKNSKNRLKQLKNILKTIFLNYEMKFLQRIPKNLPSISLFMKKKFDVKGPKNYK